jgi:segregation and condensation protein A
MKDLAIDVASEYLVMAATLAWIKSKTLLPAQPGSDEDDDEEEDPRADLVRRLLEYQKYKHVASQLRSRATMGKEMFERGTSEPVPEGPAPLAPVSVFKLFDAFDKVLKRANQQADHNVLFERVTITERIVELTEMLNKLRQVKFEQLFFTDAEGEQRPNPTKLELVVTFLALLEMCKMRLARIRQEDALGELMVEVRSKHLDEDGPNENINFSSEFDAPAPQGEAESESESETQSESESETETASETPTSESETETESESDPPRTHQDQPDEPIEHETES